MNKLHKTLLVGVVGLALTLTAGALAASLVHGSSRATRATGPGMMGGGYPSGSYGPGMMGGSFGGVGAGGAGASGTTKPSTVQLSTIASRINSWLAQSDFSGFKVAQVMAFSNNDYVAVHDASGKPAFELLTDVATNWVMEEPPSMMWNNRYGMMGDSGSYVGPMMGGWYSAKGWNGWYGAGHGKVTSTAQAVDVANKWLTTASPGEQVASDAGGRAMGQFPGYYSFDTTRNGKTAGMLSVNARNGAVWYHTWHGTFLAEHEF